ncbi:MAG TPA: cyclophilin-like fold protein [Nitrososphaeraceae archaeon]|jgi:hypothetical protein|nr:cyclophilin-like fold protein [Nitrososphaeraceae archaeon]
MDVGSISKVKVILEISGKGVSQGHIVRHLSPLTSSAILKSLPIQRRANKFKDRFVYIETELALGREKQRTNFKRGDLAFMTFHGSICVFLNDTISTPMNPLGVVTTHLEMLETIVPGDLITINRQS